jgi:hypothetical protein
VEVFFTEEHGFTVLASDRPSDFAQQDEEWWQTAIHAGAYTGPVRYDSSAAALSMEHDVAIRTTPTARPVGVLKAVFELGRLRSLLASAVLDDSAYIQIVDLEGRLLASHDEGQQLLRPLAENDLPRLSDSTASGVLSTQHGDELVVSVPANGATWRVLFRQPTRAAYASAHAARRVVWIGTLGLLTLTLGVLFLLGRWLDRQVTAPVRAAATITAWWRAGTSPLPSRPIAVIRRRRATSCPRCTRWSGPCGDWWARSARRPTNPPPWPRRSPRPPSR